jgi:hypothetical protein
MVGMARKIRRKQFILDGEAVVLGLDGISDFNALHARKHDQKVQLYAVSLALSGDDLRRMPFGVEARSRSGNLAASRKSFVRSPLPLHGAQAYRCRESRKSPDEFHLKLASRNYSFDPPTYARSSRGKEAATSIFFDTAATFLNVPILPI